MKYSQTIFCSIVCLSALVCKGQEVKVSSGMTVSVDGPVYIMMNGMGLNNNGNFRMFNGTLAFTGDAKEGAAYIGGSSLLQIHHLRIDRNSGDLQLNTSITVLGNLELVQGNLDLNNYKVDLGTTGMLVGESPAARVIGKNGGYISATAELNSPQNISPGNLGLQLNSKGNMGSTTIIRGHVQQINDIGELSIQRYYEIDPTYSVDVKAELVANFLDVESSLNSDEIALWRSKDGGGKWTAVDKTNNTYVISEAMVRDPLRLTYFTGMRESSSGASFLQLYPNPVMEKFTLSFTYPKQEEILINLYNSNGQLLESRRIKTFDGLNKIDWQVGKYPGGNYQLRFAGEKLKTMTFTKQ